MPNSTELPIELFSSPADWERWLEENYGSEQIIWLKIAKKSAVIATVTYDEALDIALCYGWIDGQRKSYDENYFVQRFTPRRAQSLWSKRNVAKIAGLLNAARMQPAGLAEVEAAQRDGRWQAAYDSSKDMTIPEDFLRAVQQNPQAEAFLRTLNKTSLYTIAWRLQTAKTPKTRARRFGVLPAMLEKG